MSILLLILIVGFLGKRQYAAIPLNTLRMSMCKVRHTLRGAKELAEIIRQTKYFYNFALSKRSDKGSVNVSIVHYKFTAFIVIIQIIRNLYFTELTLFKINDQGITATGIA